MLLSYRGRAIRPRTAGQKHYVDAIRENIVTFAIGPAGTGKTYLAMAMAHLHEAAYAPWKIDLGDIAGDDDLCSVAEAGERHLHRGSPPTRRCPSASWTMPPSPS